MKTSDRFNRQSITYIILCALFVIFTSSFFSTSVLGQVIIQGVQQLAGGNFTSAVTFSVNPTLFTDGTSTAPGIAFASEPGLGFYRAQSAQIYLQNGKSLGIGAYGGGAVFLATNTIQEASLGKIGWAASTNEQGTLDTGISRSAIGTLAVGNGTQGDFSGTVKATTINAVTAFQANGVAGATHAACSVSVTAITVTNGIITSITCS